MLRGILQTDVETGRDVMGMNFKITTRDCFKDDLEFRRERGWCVLAERFGRVLVEIWSLELLLRTLCTLSTENFVVNCTWSVKVFH